jgi:hypothetical protein
MTGWALLFCWSFIEGNRSTIRRATASPADHPMLFCSHYRMGVAVLLEGKKETCSLLQHPPITRCPINCPMLFC